MDIKITPAPILIGASVLGGTAGSILFVGTGPVLSQDNGNLFWDDTNKRLGIGTASPSVPLHVWADVGIRVGGSATVYTKVNYDGTGTVGGDYYLVAGANLHLQVNAGTMAMYLKTNGNVGIGTTTPAYLASVGHSDGQQFGLHSLTELTTIAAAATTDTTIQIPVNAIVIGVSVRVTTVIPTAATFTVIGTTSSTAFQTGASISTAATTTDVGTKSCPYLNTTAQTIRITPNLTPADNTGRVRATIHYMAVTAPTA